MDILKLALQMAPAIVVLDAIHEKYPSWPSSADQEEIASALSVDHINEYRPPVRGWKYLFKVLEKDIRELSASANVDEQDMFTNELMEIIVESQCAVELENNSGFVSFGSVTISDLLIPIKVIQSHNQVGTRVWGAGVYLAELMQRVPDILIGQTVLEVGAGVGITGLLIARAIPAAQRPEKVIMTDFHHEVVDLLDYNIQLNCGRGGDEVCSLLADTLDWSSVQADDYLRYGAKVMLAADCTYSESGNVNLVYAMKLFLKTMTSTASVSAPTAPEPETDSHAPPAAVVDTARTAQTRVGNQSYVQTVLSQDKPLVLIACTIRHPATYAHFRSLIDADLELQVSDLTAWAAAQFPSVPTYYYPEDRSAIQLLCIHGR